MTARTVAFAWAKTLMLAGAAVVGVGALSALGLFAVLLMLAGDGFTALVLLFAMASMSLALVLLVRELRGAFVKTRWRTASGAASVTGKARLAPPSNLQQSYFREPPVT